MKTMGQNDKTLEDEAKEWNNTFQAYHTTGGKTLIELARMLRYRRLVNMLSCRGRVLIEL